mmetsp:Transcript_33178/g.96095  ORF Transcript_33178/g.96095 Transcript_33178/m.96095 type:complete len:159 (-) Transcript_33178:267-743(-)
MAPAPEGEGETSAGPRSWSSGIDWGLQTRLYIGIEAVWHVTLFAACYRYAPVLRLSKTPWGKRFLDTTRTFVAGRSSPRWGSAASATTNFFQTPWARASAEWFFFNKVFMPVSWPAKLALAHYMAGRIQSQQRGRIQAEAKASGAGAAPVSPSSTSPS